MAQIKVQNFKAVSMLSFAMALGVSAACSSEDVQPDGEGASAGESPERSGGSSSGGRAGSSGGAKSTGGSSNAGGMGGIVVSDGGSSSGGQASGSGGEAGASNVDEEQTSTLGRLLIGDGDEENPRMMVLDLDDGEIVGEFPTLGSVRAYSSSPRSGYAWANQRVPGLVEVLTSGIRVEGGLVKKSEPYVLTDRFEGPLPTHWVNHDDWVVSFNDGDGSFDFVLERSLGGARPLFSVAHTGKAHHGVAVITHGNVFATIPHELADTGDPGPGSAHILPIGVSVRRLATPDTIAKIGDDELKSEDCPLLHGETANDEVVAFGCGDGVLIAERQGGQFSFRKLANPEGAPEGQRVGTLRALDGVPALVGNWGSGFVIIPYQEDEPEWIEVALGTANRGFGIEAQSGALIVLGGNGTLYRFNPTTGAPIGTPVLGVIPEVTTGQAAPGLALGDARVFVADPRSGEVVEVPLDEPSERRTFMVGGKPNSVAAFGAHLGE